MIRREHAECQALRLTVLPGMADLKNTSEIINALKLGSHNLEHASRIVDGDVEDFRANRCGAHHTHRDYQVCQAYGSRI